LPQLLTGGDLRDATGAIAQPDGTILLTGSNTRISTAPGTAIVSGKLDVTSTIGGNITVLGDRVALTSATVDASGINGGGNIRIGGDYQGRGPSPNAARTFVSYDSLIRADALATGNGGQVIVWSDQATRFYGRLTATGGSNGGNGGFAEVSGRTFLDYSGTANLTAFQGQTGTLLLDPTNITVVAGGNTPAELAANDQFADPGVDSTINNGTINAATANVILQATNNITFAAPINMAAPNVGLTAEAGNDITINAGADITTQRGNLVFNADADSSGDGFVLIVGNLSTSGGDITVRGNASRDDTSGINNFGSINSGGGAISLTGTATGNSPASNARGVDISGGQLNSGGGAISLTGTSRNGYGVAIAFGSINSQGGAITATGVGNSPSSSLGDVLGIIVFGTSTITSAGGDIRFTGTSAGSDSILIFTAPNPGTPSIDSGGGRLIMSGINNGTGRGISFGTANISSGGGEITLTGQSQQNNGINIATPIASGGGNITLNGQSNQSDGIVVADSIASGGGNITLNGDRVTIDPTGSLNSSGGALAFSVSDRLTLNNPINTTGNFSFTSQTALTLTNAVNTNGGAITLSGPTIDTSATTLNSSSTTGNGGAISLTTTQGDLVTGDLNSSGVQGGAITLIAPTAITTGIINSSGRIGNGGNVTIDPIGDVQVTSINAQGGAAGTGGIVDITAGQFFRASGSFIDQNGINASISTAGGQGGGAITIRHGGGLLGTFFEIGNATTNGTVGAITTGNSNRIDPVRSFLEPYIQGNIQILTAFNSSAIAAIQQSTPSEALSVATDIPFASIAQLFTVMEESLTRDFVAYLSLPGMPPIRTLSDAQNTLKAIEEKTGVRPALLYVSFRDASDVERSGNRGNVNPTDNKPLELLLVTGNGNPVYRRIPEATRSRVLKVAQIFRNEVADPSKTLTQSYLPSAEQLYRWIIDPIKSELQAQGIRNLAFILDNGFRFIPVAALHNGQSFLMEQYSLGLMPTFSLTDIRYGSVQNEQLLAAGASLFPDGENPLPAVPVELTAITQQSSSPTQPLLNQSFTLGNLTTQRQQMSPGIVHLATHGRFLPGNISQSYIRFWDISLGLDRLEQLGWNTPTLELATLSACQMALEDVNTELGFAGFAVKTGAKSALASLWNISDEGTAGLMAEFYQKLRRSLIKADALQQAQISMLNGTVRLQQDRLVWSGGELPLPKELTETGNRAFSHPYYWAAFTMIGSPW
jgi:CHAT domain-containing protein